MVYRGEFYMDLGNTGRNYYVGIMEYIWDGVVYDFIDNEEFFSCGQPLHQPGGRHPQVLLLQPRPRWPRSTT